MTVVCVVGTTHPLAFAGLTLSMLALAADGVRPVAVVAGVTAQDAARVTARRAVDADLVGAQFEALRDAGVAAFHVGALLSADIVRAVSAGLARFPGLPVVVDPVVAATGGGALADPSTVTALRDTLLPRATLVTPNLDEAEALLGRPVRDVAAMGEAASALRDLGARAALVKGGHLNGEAVDVFSDGDGTRSFADARLATTLRGTGDLLASTIAGRLAAGDSLEAGIRHARRRVREAIANGVPFAGARVVGLPGERPRDD
ncbi:MAG TPA: PfkB family carbohydrate kinase [Candidatus Baltobacteraceae bacterium]|nr:PfkB family carbohydrate kinase [Candidatus Baltobacteraceae bacterium]